MNLLATQETEMRAAVKARHAEPKMQSAQTQKRYWQNAGVACRCGSRQDCQGEQEWWGVPHHPGTAPT